MGTVPVPCASCGQAFAASAATCPSCNAPRTTVETDPSTPSVAAVPPLVLPASYRPMEACPVCGGHRGEGVVAVEALSERTGADDAARPRPRFEMHQIEIEGVCASCRRKILARRQLTSVLLALPLVMIPIGLLPGREVWGVFGAVYGLAIYFRSLSYGLFDDVAFGARLGRDLADRLPSDAAIRFPGGPSTVIVRLGLAALVLGAGMILR